MDGAAGGGEGEGAEDVAEGARGVGVWDGFGEAGGEEDGEVVFVGELGEVVEGGGGGGNGEEGGDGVDDEEGEVGDVLDGVMEVVDKGGLVGGVAAWAGGEGDGEDVDKGQVCVEVEESWEEGICGVVFGAQQEGGGGKWGVLGAEC
ncbi:MAG TPA: hypothetical protein VHQ47_18450 [Phycisphaerae bacterium]|nr:hypothetical protein [Phycisphaerae bacterium]